MPRQPRYFIPKVPQHVIQRGVDRAPVFFEHNDYCRYLSTLREAAQLYRCDVHAYVLMTNHVHLLVTPHDSRALPQVIQAIGRGYVQWINAKYNRTGSLWEGRYKACLVQSDRYLLSCHRYIELNPVRAGMVANPAGYPFSSYASNALGIDDALLAHHDIYQQLGTTRSEITKRYRELFTNEIPAEELVIIRQTTNACLVLGNDLFKDRIEQMLDRPVRHKKNGRPAKATKRIC